MKSRNLLKLDMNRLLVPYIFLISIKVLVFEATCIATQIRARNDLCRGRCSIAGTTTFFHSTLKHVNRNDVIREILLISWFFEDYYL